MSGYMTVTNSPTVFMSSGSSLQNDLDVVEQQFQGANNTVGNFSDCTILHQVHTHDSSLIHLYMCEWLYCLLQEYLDGLQSLCSDGV